MGEFMALLIPLFALSIPIVAIWTKHQRHLAEMQMKNTADNADQFAGSKHELEDRVRVLERIITDKGYDVATQIEALRETRKVDALLDGRNRETMS